MNFIPILLRLCRVLADASSGGRSLGIAYTLGEGGREGGRGQEEDWPSLTQSPACSDGRTPGLGAPGGAEPCDGKGEPTEFDTPSINMLISEP